MTTSYVLRSTPPMTKEEMSKGGTLDAGVSASALFLFCMRVGKDSLDADSRRMAAQMYFLAGTWRDLPAGVLLDIVEERATVSYVDSEREGCKDVVIELEGGEE